MRIALNANRIIRVFDSEDLIMVTVDVAKNNTCKVVIAGGREFSVHCSVSKLVERLEPQMGGRFFRITRDTCINIDYVHELSTDGELRLFDRSVNKLLPKLLILSRARILSLVDLLTTE